MSNLLVQNIKHTNNTTAMTVDSSGNTTVSQNLTVSGSQILTPARPSFFVKGNGGWVDHGGSVVTYFKTSNQAVEVISNVGSHYDASTGRFTVPVTGLYQFNVSLYMNNTGDAVHYAVIYVDGSHLHNNFMIYQNADSGYPDNSLNFSMSAQLTASQYVEIKVTEDVYGFHSNWHGYLIG
mgnify:FL=1|tara:strand:+ start:1281 stop:1820 length:540 start_codon:yes stop_codon:yes gene_type:complete